MNKRNLSTETLSNQIYVSILEILHDDRLYHHSYVGTDYCRLTEQGQYELVKYINMVGPYILAQENQELDERAKAIVVKELKK